MANQRKTYFLCPTWDYHPSGPIQLGNIITSPSRPADALNGPDAPRPAATSLFPTTTKTDVKWSSDNLRSGRYGLWTQFLSFLGFSVDLGFEHTAHSEQSFAFDTLETTEFIPTTQFLQDCLSASPAAVDFITKSRFRKALYVVTAVKISRGSCVAETSSGTSRGAEVGVGVDGALLVGTPVGLGPEVRANRASGERGSFSGPSDFVFAFRLRRVLVQRAGTVAGHSEYTFGAMYGADEGKGLQEGLPFVVHGTELEDASGLEFGGGPGEVIVEDGEEMVCVRPPVASR